MLDVALGYLFGVATWLFKQTIWSVSFDLKHLLIIYIRLLRDLVSELTPAYAKLVS